MVCPLNGRQGRLLCSCSLLSQNLHFTGMLTNIWNFAIIGLGQEEMGPPRADGPQGQPLAHHCSGSQELLRVPTGLRSGLYPHFVGDLSESLNLSESHL